MPSSTYHYTIKKLQEDNKDKWLIDKILEIRKTNPEYGFRRIHGELKTDKNIKIVINKKKVQRICQELAIQCTLFGRKKTTKYNSYTDKKNKANPNRLNRRFETNIEYQKITTDTTEFKYYEKINGRLIIKKLYLDPFMDLYNREILSYSIAPNPSADDVMEALNKVIKITDACKYRRTFHSDQGWLYKMKKYKRTLKENRIFQSMSRKGNCYDNSVMENFFGLLKQEMYYHRIYSSYDELKSSIEKYIYNYNNNRIKEKLGYLSPVKYRMKNKKNVI